MPAVIEKSINAYNNFLKMGKPHYVIRIYKFSDDVINNNKYKNDNLDNNILLKVLMIRLISIHLNGKVIILDDEYVKILLNIKERFNFINITSRPLINELLLSYELSNDYERSVIIESFQNSYFKKYLFEYELIDLVKDLKSFKDDSKDVKRIKPIY